MNKADPQRVWTLEEIAAYLKVNEEVISRDVENGDLVGFEVGGSWRCNGADLKAYLRLLRQRSNPTRSGTDTFDHPSVDVAAPFIAIGPFEYTWPKKGGKLVVRYPESYETTRDIEGHTLTFTLGFTRRKLAGKERVRVYVWLGNKPLVAFAGSDNHDSDGLLASVIKLADGRHLSPDGQPSAEYASFRLAKYDSVVTGPHASKSMAVIVHKDDKESMLQHAIIRARLKGLL